MQPNVYDVTVQYTSPFDDARTSPLSTLVDAVSWCDEDLSHIWLESRNSSHRKAAMAELLGIPRRSLCVITTELQEIKVWFQKKMLVLKTA